MTPLCNGLKPSARGRRRAGKLPFKFAHALAKRCDVCGLFRVNDTPLVPDGVFFGFGGAFAGRPGEMSGQHAGRTGN